MDEEEELTAWHESGHAFMAVLCGGTLDRVSVEPPNDDGPDRFGDTIVRWQNVSSRQIPLLEIKVSLSGPIAESIYRGDSQLVQIDQEWLWDWNMATVAATQIVATEQINQLLSSIAKETWQLFDGTNPWSAISAIADELSAHGTLEHHQVSEIVSFWMRR